MAAMSVEAFKARESSLKNSIQNGDVEALRLLGNLYYIGLSGNEKNHDKAYPFWKEAADKGDPIAAGNIGTRLFDGVYGKERQSEAFPYLEMAAKYCEQYGNMTAPLVKLAHAYNNGIGCEKDKKKAKKYYMYAAVRNDATAQYCLGLRLYEEDVEKSIFLRWLCCSHVNGNKEAEKLLNKLISAPKPLLTKKEMDDWITDIFDNGIFPIIGTGFPNLEEFEDWVRRYKISADEGDVISMRMMAGLLRTGYGVEGQGKDEKLSLYYFEKAADRGDAESKRILGQYYLSTDEEKSFKSIYQAAAQKEPKARFLLGMMYRVGIGCRPDPQKAIQLLTPIAMLNYGKAQYELSRAILDTQVEEKADDDFSHNMDITLKSIHWLACAYINGDQDAIETAKETGMDSTDIFNNKIELIKKYGVDPVKSSSITNKTENDQSRRTGSNSVITKRKVVFSYYFNGKYNEQGKKSIGGPPVYVYLDNSVIGSVNSGCAGQIEIDEQSHSFVFELRQSTGSKVSEKFDIPGTYNAPRVPLKYVFKIFVDEDTSAKGIAKTVGKAFLAGIFMGQNGVARVAEDSLSFRVELLN